MSETDPHELADALEREADVLEQQSERLGHEVSQAREDWQRKRADDAVPGAPPPEHADSGSGDESGDGHPGSPAPQSPPPSAGPGEAETPPEGEAGPPKDVIEDSDSE